MVDEYLNKDIKIWSLRKYSIGKGAEWPVEQNRKLEAITNRWNLDIWQMERMHFSINGAGTTGYPYKNKNEVRSLPHTICVINVRCKL